MRKVPPVLRLAGVGGGTVARTASVATALVGDNGMALNVTVGGTGVGGLMAGGAVGALGGAAGATTGGVVGVRVGVAETVGVAVITRATYGVVVLGGAAAGGSVAVGVKVGVGVGVRLAVGVAVAGRQISASVRSGGTAPCAMVLAPQAQPLTSPLCTIMLLAPICENCQWSPTNCEYDQ